jgi:hypothetical protein
MAGEDKDDGKFEAGEHWEGKTSFAPGVPTDPDAIPVLRYQALMGKVFVLQRWRNGSTARGEIALAELEKLVGGGVKEGWYNALGEYLGASIDLEAQ